MVLETAFLWKGWVGGGGERSLITTLLFYFISEPQIQLLLEIRRVTLRDEVPDAFMSTLLTIMRFADNLHPDEDPLLGRYYTDVEYEKAKPCLHKILRNSGIRDPKPNQ